MIKQKIFSNKGFTVSDIAIAIIIIAIFVSIIATSFYNYYISIQSKNRRTMATNISIDLIENIEIMNYSDITRESVDNLINEFTADGTILSGYTATVDLSNYNEIEGNQNKEDLIKIIKVTIEYTVGKNQEKYEVTRLITK